MVAGRGVLRLLPASVSPTVMLARIGAEQRSSNVAPISDTVTTIGRGLQNSVVLLDTTVSREHAVLEQTGAGTWLIHNVSAQQPLAVDGRQIVPGGQVQLAPGNIIRIGRCSLCLLAPESASADVNGRTAMAVESGSTQVIGPGVTLQFALQGQRYPQLRWLIGALAGVLLVLSGVATLSGAAQLGRYALSSGGVARVLLALTIPLIPALGATLLTGIFDRYEREPWTMLLGAFVFGAIIAVPPTLVLERAVSTLVLSRVGGSGAASTLAYAGGQAVVAGVIEEVVKGAGLLLLVFGLRDEFDNVTDGVLYGVMIGAGFAVVENFVYFALSPSNELPYLVLGRIVLGWLSHSTFTALFGAGIGYARERGRRHGSRLYFPVLGLLAAILLHVLFDWVVFAATAEAGQATTMISSLALMAAVLLLGYGPVFAAQVFLLRILLASLAREAETVRTYLADELLFGVVLPDEYLILQDAGLRAASEQRILRNFGLWAYLTARAFYQTATGLAFRKWHVAQGDRRKVSSKQPEDVYRTRVAQLRSSLSRQLGNS